MARIGIDLDGVLCDFVKGFREACLTLTEIPTEVLRRPAMRYDFYEDWGMGRQEFLGVLHQATHNGLYAGLDSLLDSYDVDWLDDMADEHTFVFITHRPYQARRDTVKWINYMLGIATGGEGQHELHITGEKWKVPVDCMIDDNPLILNGMPDSVERIMRLQPWNYHNPTVDTHRVWSLGEALSLIDEMEVGK